MKPTDPKAEHRSAFDRALDELEPQLHTYDISGFFGLGDKPLPKVGMRLAAKNDEDTAVQAAWAHVTKVAAGIDEVKTDADIVTDAKVVEILWRVCRDPDDPKYPLFASPNRMREKLGTDRLACLMNLYDAVRTKEGGLLFDISDERVEAAVEIAAKASGTNLPEELFARMPRAYLIHLIVLIALKLRDAREELAASATPPLGEAGYRDAPLPEPAP